MSTQFAIVPLLLLLASCSLLQPGTPGSTQNATETGRDAGTLTCTVMQSEAPLLVPQVRDAVARGEAVLATPDITGQALIETLSVIDDFRWRLYAQAGLRMVLQRLAGASSLDVTIAPDSPVAVGAGAFFKACNAALSVTT